METSQHSTLPVWTVTVVDVNGKKMLGIECPSCGNKAIVGKNWKSPKVNRYATRTCTYCFKTAILPRREAELR